MHRDGRGREEDGEVSGRREKERRSGRKARRSRKCVVVKRYTRDGSSVIICSFTMAAIEGRTPLVPSSLLVPCYPARRRRRQPRLLGRPARRNRLASRSVSRPLTLLLPPSRATCIPGAHYRCARSHESRDERRIGYPGTGTAPCRGLQNRRTDVPCRLGPPLPRAS